MIKWLSTLVFSQKIVGNDRNSDCYYVRTEVFFVCGDFARLKTDDLMENDRAMNRRRAQSITVKAEFIVVGQVYNSNRTITRGLFQGFDVCNFFCYNLNGFV